MSKYNEKIVSEIDKEFDQNLNEISDLLIKQQDLASKQTQIRKSDEIHSEARQVEHNQTEEAIVAALKEELAEDSNDVVLNLKRERDSSEKEELNDGEYEDEEDEGEEGEEEQDEILEEDKITMNVLKKVPKEQMHTFRLFKGASKQDLTSYYYFDSNEDDLVRCSGCSRTYKPSTRIDTLIRHLTKKHGIRSASLPDQSSGQAFLMPYSKSQEKPTNKVKEQSLEEAIVRWILTDSLSLSSLESPAFLNMLKLAAPDVELPTRERLRELFTNMLESNKPLAMNDNNPLGQAFVDTLGLFGNTEIPQVLLEPMETVTQEPNRSNKRKKKKSNNDFHIVTFNGQG